MKKIKLGKTVTYISVGVVLIVVLTIVASQLHMFDDADVKLINIDPQTVIRLILAISIVMVLYNVVLLILRAFQGKSDIGRAKTLGTMLASFSKYLAFIVGACWVLSIVGVNVSTIFASVGILALILGFGAESLVSDVVTGIFVIIENQYNVGDIIEVDGYRGTVKDMGIRTVSIIDAGGNIKIINNSDLKNVINRSNQRSVAVTTVGISYDHDLEEIEAKLEPILADIKERNKDIFIDKVLYLGVDELADSAVVLKFLADVTEENIFSGRRLLNRELKIAFDKADIHIPYPQIDIHSR